MYTDGASPEEQSFFVTERHCFSDLVEGLATQCPCGMVKAPWVLESVVQVSTLCAIQSIHIYKCMLMQKGHAI